MSMWARSSFLGWLVACAVAAASPVVAQTGAAPPKIAVVDTARVMRESKLARRLIESVAAEQDGYQKKLDQLRDEIEKKSMDQREMWRPGSKEADEAKLEVGMLQWRLETLRDMYRSWVQKRTNAAHIEIYARMGGIVARLAQSRGIELVIKTMSTEQNNAVLQITAIESSPLLYYAPQLDITKDVISLLDAEEKSEAKTEEKTDGKSDAKTEGKDGDGGPPSPGAKPEK